MLNISNQTENEKFLEQKAAQTNSEFVIDLENESQQTLSQQDLITIGKFFVYDEIGNRHLMSDLWSEFKTIFVFVRSFLCFTTKEYIEDLALVSREKLKEKQIRLVVIGCAHWKHIRNFRKLTKYPYLIFCDVDYDIYKKLGFVKKRDYGTSNESVHVKSSTLGGIMSSAYRAMTTSITIDFQGDFDQQGGSLIIGPGLKLHYFHSDKNARDHTPINKLLNLCEIDAIDFKNEYLKKTQNL